MQSEQSLLGDLCISKDPRLPQVGSKDWSDYFAGLKFSWGHMSGDIFSHVTAHMFFMEQLEKNVYMYVTFTRTTVNPISLYVKNGDIDGHGYPA